MNQRVLSVRYDGFSAADTVLNALLQEQNMQGYRLEKELYMTNTNALLLFTQEEPQIEIAYAKE